MESWASKGMECTNLTYQMCNNLNLPTVVQTSIPSGSNLPASSLIRLASAVPRRSIAKQQVYAEIRQFKSPLHAETYQSLPLTGGYVSSFGMAVPAKESRRGLGCFTKNGKSQNILMKIGINVHVIL